MKLPQYKHAIAVWFAAMFAISPALGYGGPGLGLGFLLVLAGAAAAIFLSAVGFVWYPAKRLIQRIVGRPQQDDSDEQPDDPST